jgi:hypothetical protein
VGLRMRRRFDLQDAGLAWKYYTPEAGQSGYIWSVLKAFHHIRFSDLSQRNVRRVSSFRMQRMDSCRTLAGSVNSSHVYASSALLTPCLPKATCWPAPKARTPRSACALLPVRHTHSHRSAVVSSRLCQRDDSPRCNPPAVMKLLGHTDPGMTMRYIEVPSTDLHREVSLARSKPRHLAPQPKAPMITPRSGLDGVVDSIFFGQHAREMLRRALPDGFQKLPRSFSNRLSKILSKARKLHPPRQGAEIGRISRQRADLALSRTFASVNPTYR